MKYAWTIVAGEPGKPAGVVGTYRTRQGALANWPRYAAYLRRDRVDEDTWRTYKPHYSCATGYFRNALDCKQYPAGCKACYEEE